MYTLTRTRPPTRTGPCTLNAARLLSSRRGDARDQEPGPCPSTSCVWRSLPYRTFPYLRYICFLNGLFGAFVGLLYNEAFAFPMGFFGTSRWEGFEEEGLSGMTCEHLERCEIWGDMGRFGEIWGGALGHDVRAPRAVRPSSAGTPLRMASERVDERPLADSQVRA